MNAAVIKKGFTYIIACAVITVLCVFITSVFATPAYAATTSTTLDNGKTITRYEGDDRYHTSRLITSDVASYGISQGIIVCSGENGKFSDTLCASGLAGALGYPIVLTSGSSTSLTSHTRDAIAEVTGGAAVDVIVLGGTDTISAEIENELSAYDSDGYITRISGEDRYTTSEEVYYYGRDHGGWTAECAILAKGNNFPDALSASSYSATFGAPILLTDADAEELPFYILEIANYTDLGFVIVGGEASVSAEKEIPLRWYTWVDRVSGNSRYETNSAFIDWELSHGMDLSTLGVATGESFPDALASGYLLSLSAAPLLLVSSSESTNAAAYSFIESEMEVINSVLIFGGTNSVTTATEQAIADNLVDKTPVYENDIVRRAYESLGVDYVWGACSPTAFDCSGLVSYCVTGVYDHRYSTVDIYFNTDGKWMDVDDPQPGDIWVWDDGSYNGHCGVYIGNDQMIHAPGTGLVVTIGPARNYGKYVRYIG